MSQWFGDHTGWEGLSGQQGLGNLAGYEPNAAQQLSGSAHGGEEDTGQLAEDLSVLDFGTTSGAQRPRDATAAAPRTPVAPAEEFMIFGGSGSKVPTTDSRDAEEKLDPPEDGDDVEDDE
jgi:hypothetical protein